MKNKFQIFILLFCLAGSLVSASVTGTLAINNRKMDPIDIPTGSSFLITVSDADRNTDSTQVETIEVLVNVNGSRQARSIELSETEKWSGIFEGRVALSGNPAGITSQVIEAFQHDIITITYIDTENEDGHEETNTRTGNVTGSLLLTDASGVKQLNFASGSTLYVQVTDGDRNTDENVQETITATVVSDTDTDGETVTLTETGVSTGIFMGSLSFSESSGSSGDGVLQVTRGDRLTGTYVDPTDDFGNEITLTAIAYFNVTLLSGAITSNATWDVSGSPYLVTGDVEVASSVLLKIDPGVKIRFTESSDDQNSGMDMNRSELRILGTLRAVGTVSDSIIFTSNALSPVAGDWYGIFHDGTASGKIHLKYSRMEYYKYGIHISNHHSQPSSFSDIDSLRIENSTFRYGSSAVLSNSQYYYGGYYITDNTVHQSPFIDLSTAASYAIHIQNNTITNAFSHGIAISNALTWNNNGYSDFDTLYAVIDNNIIEFDALTELSNSYAINIHAGHADNSDFHKKISITNNTINGNNINSMGGINSSSNSINDNNSFLFSGNQIINTQGKALNMEAYQESRVSNNVFRKNRTQDTYETLDGTDAAVYIRSSSCDFISNTIDSSGNYGLYIEPIFSIIDSNTITNNSGGIYLSGNSESPSTPTIRYNNITNNVIRGISLANYVNPLINYNDIFSNSNTYTYDIYNDVSSSVYAEINARLNYWGETTTAEMVAGDNPKDITTIYDQYEDASKSFVN